VITNRELATVIWLSVLLLFSLTKPDVRSALSSLSHAFFTIKIILPLVIFAAWLGVAVWLAHEVGLWKAYLVKDTVFWFGFTGLALFVNVGHAVQDEQFVRRKIRSTVGVSVVLEFFVNIISFGLIAELVLQLVIALLVALAVFTGMNKQYVAVKRLTETSLSGILLALSFLTATDIYRHRRDLDLGELWRSFALGVWLPIAAVPFIYVFALVARHELAFVRMRFANQGQTPGSKARLAVVLGLNGQLRELHAFAGGWAGRVASAPSFRASLQRVREFRRHRAEQRAEETEE